MLLTFQVEVPDGDDVRAADLRLALAARLYEQALLSAGHAAEVAGLSKRAFIEALGGQGVSFFNGTVEDLRRDVENA